MEALMVKPVVKVEKLEMEDPILEKGSLRTARSLITNPTTKEFEYFLELYLDVAKVAVASGYVTIPALGSLNVDFAVQMPLIEETYHVYLDAWAEGKLLKHYQAEDVTLQAFKAYYCNHCFQGFFTGRELAIHILAEHPETVEWINIRWE